MAWLDSLATHAAPRRDEFGTGTCRAANLRGSISPLTESPPRAPASATKSKPTTAQRCRVRPSAPYKYHLVVPPPPHRSHRELHEQIDVTSSPAAEKKRTTRRSLSYSTSLCSPRLSSRLRAAPSPGRTLESVSAAAASSGSVAATVSAQGSALASAGAALGLPRGLTPVLGLGSDKTRARTPARTQAPTVETEGPARGRTRAPTAETEHLAPALTLARTPGRTQALTAEARARTRDPMPALTQGPAPTRTMALEPARTQGPAAARTGALELARTPDPELALTLATVTASEARASSHWVRACNFTKTSVIG
jgi:hypothetical protein